MEFGMRLDLEVLLVLELGCKLGTSMRALEDDKKGTLLGRELGLETKQSLWHT
jgi:hypothetical protein